MKKINNIEMFSLAMVLLLFILTKLFHFSHLFFLYYSILVALYFFPIRLFLKGDSQNRFFYIVSSITISWIITISSISFYIPIEDVFRIALLVLSMLNLLLAYILYDKKEKSFALHILMLFLVPMVLY